MPRETPRIDRLMKHIDDLDERLLKPMQAVIYGVLILTAVLWGLLRLHWALALIGTIALAVGLVVLLAKMNRAFLDEQSTAIIGLMLAGTTMLAILVCAWCSYFLYMRDPAFYSPSPASASPLSPLRFIDYYWWLTIDFVPGVKVWETFHVAAPITYSRMTAGLPVFAFRIIIAWRVLVALNRWLSPGTDAATRHRGAEASV